MWPRWLARLAVVDLVLIAGFSALAPGAAGGFPAVANPLGVAAAPWLADVAGIVIGATAVVLVPAVVLVCLVRWRRSTGDARWQLGLLSIGSAVFVAALPVPGRGTARVMPSTTPAQRLAVSPGPIRSPRPPMRFLLLERR